MEQDVVEQWDLVQVITDFEGMRNTDYMGF